MTYGVESKSGFFARSDAREANRGASVALNADLTKEEMSRGRRGCKPGATIPFNGLLTNNLLAALPGEDFIPLLPHLEPISLACDEDISELNDSHRFVYFPETVVISHINVLENGSTSEAAVIGREGMTGLSTILSSHQTAYWTQVTIAGSALRVRTEVIKREFARGRALQRLLLGYAGASMAQLSQKAVCNNHHAVKERLCTWLLMIQDRVTDGQLPLTHEQIARHLGARRAGVTSAANALRYTGAISYSRARIQILDRQALESSACECYGILRDEFNRLHHTQNGCVSFQSPGVTA